MRVRTDVEQIELERHQSPPEVMRLVYPSVNREICFVTDAIVRIPTYHYEYLINSRPLRFGGRPWLAVAGGDDQQQYEEYRRAHRRHGEEPRRFPKDRKNQHEVDEIAPRQRVEHGH